MLGVCFDVAAADFDCCASTLDAVPMMQATKKTIVNKVGANLIPADGCGMCIQCNSKLGFCQFRDAGWLFAGKPVVPKSSVRVVG